MKTSEFIRAAVDNWLAANFGDYTIENKSRGLCRCFEKEYGNVGPDPYYWRDHPDLVECINDELRESSPWLFQITYDEKEFAEQQAMRFMFAEFLALYFEDMGD